MKKILLVVVALALAGCASNGDQSNGPIQRFRRGFGQGMIDSARQNDQQTADEASREQEARNQQAETQMHQHKEDFRAMQRGELP